MSLKTQLTEDMKTAMRAKDQVSLSTIRLINAAIKQFEVDERTQADDAKVIFYPDQNGENSAKTVPKSTLKLVVKIWLTKKTRKSKSSTATCRK